MFGTGNFLAHQLVGLEYEWDENFVEKKISFSDLGNLLFYPPDGGDVYVA